jgi:hypothetical protein
MLTNWAQKGTDRQPNPPGGEAARFCLYRKEVRRISMTLYPEMTDITTGCVLHHRALPEQYSSLF